MVFSSSLFLFAFLPVFLLLYFLAPQRLKNWVALLASLFFYAWGAPAFVFLVLLSILIDFQLAKRMELSADPKIRKKLLLASMILNLGLLFYFKYFNFFLDNLSLVLNSLDLNVPDWPQVVLPIGISFFTFQKMSYTIDVYRKRHAPLDRLRDFMLYILLFPQLIAGPIVRYNEIADQLVNRKENELFAHRISGFMVFCIGLAKKVLIANILGAQVDQYLHGDLGNMSTAFSWIIIGGYSLQIYFDFSGYSDMAIGIGRMIGFRFPENFSHPYTSKNITEFWQRWHITLGAWMKDYLYIPLGGNRVSSKARLYFNLSTVFILSGLWHGASWNFVIWGAYHGFFLIMDRLFYAKWSSKMGLIPAMLINSVVVLFGWVFFRLEEFAQARTMIGNLLGAGGKFHPELQSDFICVFGIGIFFAFFRAIPRLNSLESWAFEPTFKSSRLLVFGVISTLLLILSASFITSSGFNPFIYFRF